MQLYSELWSSEIVNGDGKEFWVMSVELWVLSVEWWILKYECYEWWIISVERWIGFGCQRMKRWIKLFPFNFLLALRQVFMRFCEGEKERKNEGEKERKNEILVSSSEIAKQFSIENFSTTNSLLMYWELVLILKL